MTPQGSLYSIHPQQIVEVCESRKVPCLTDNQYSAYIDTRHAYNAYVCQMALGVEYLHVYADS